jgi:hypothetical protein
MREIKMDNKKHNNNDAYYDTPIERPFEELPEWFARTLNSRLTTKRLPREPESGGSYNNPHSRNPQPRGERAIRNS